MAGSASRTWNRFARPASSVSRPAMAWAAACQALEIAGQISESRFVEFHDGGIDVGDDHPVGIEAGRTGRYVSSAQAVPAKLGMRAA